VSGLEVRCIRCQQTLAHVCKGDSLKGAIARLFEIEVDCRPRVRDKEANAAPFFSEAYLYALLGKEAARTVLAVVNSVIRAAGIEPEQVLQWRDDRDVAMVRAERRAETQLHSIMRQLAVSLKPGTDKLVRYQIERALQPDAEELEVE